MHKVGDLQNEYPISTPRYVKDFIKIALTRCDPCVVPVAEDFDATK